jgi:hypothetical protein|tara:strand:+ start:460 stop:564 length:105 start_codon:yes stop_codon:yes gene_type:complete
MIDEVEYDVVGDMPDEEEEGNIETERQGWERGQV